MTRKCRTVGLFAAATVALTFAISGFKTSVCVEVRGENAGNEATALDRWRVDGVEYRFDCEGVGAKSRVPGWDAVDWEYGEKTGATRN